MSAGFIFFSNFEALSVGLRQFSYVSQWKSSFFVVCDEFSIKIHLISHVRIILSIATQFFSISAFLPYFPSRIQHVLSSSAGKKTCFHFFVSFIYGFLKPKYLHYQFCGELKNGVETATLKKHMTSATVLIESRPTIRIFMSAAFLIYTYSSLGC